MDRRRFLKGTAVLSGFLTINPAGLFAGSTNPNSVSKKTAKNIIFMISDGMSSGTLAMANQYSLNTLGKTVTGSGFIWKTK